MLFYDALRYKGNYSKLNSQWFQQGHSWKGSRELFSQVKEFETNFKGERFQFENQLIFKSLKKNFSSTKTT